VKDAAQDVAEEDVTQDVAEDVLGAAENWGMGMFILPILLFQVTGEGRACGDE